MLHIIHHNDNSIHHQNDWPTSLLHVFFDNRLMILCISYTIYECQQLFLIKSVIYYDQVFWILQKKTFNKCIRCWHWPIQFHEHTLKNLFSFMKYSIGLLGNDEETYVFLYFCWGKLNEIARILQFLFLFLAF